VGVEGVEGCLPLLIVLDVCVCLVFTLERVKSNFEGLKLILKRVMLTRALVNA
jgi:hypothetical protein